MLMKIYTTARQWAADESAVAAAEFAIVFPVLFTMMVGVWDVGNAIVVNQKTIAASHVVIDLICREDNVSDDELDQAFMAGALAMNPYDAASLVIDVASVQFTDDDGTPELVWQEASDGSAGDADLVDRTEGLGVTGDGALVVQVTYEYEPLFAGTIIGNISMKERVFSRGRQVAVVARE